MGDSYMKCIPYDQWYHINRVISIPNQVQISKGRNSWDWEVVNRKWNGIDSLLRPSHLQFD